MRTCLPLLALLALQLSNAAADDIGIRAPEGFEVSLFAGDDLAHDIYSMTIDAQGRVVVSGRGYVKILHDDDGDGTADRASLFSKLPASGAHGMVFLGNDLLCTGDNHLQLIKDENGDGVADGKPFPWAMLQTPEHGANGIVHGPDGWFYVVCGNDAGVGPQLARTKTSPVKKPEAGTIVRFSPDGKTSEIFAHGFRNPYDLDFNANGQLFTVDSDGERDHHLPWYTPTRLFDVQQGMHHGWVQRGWTRSWSRPASYFDNVERLAEIGRGSPTGVVSYRHFQFPAHYRDGIFAACWTLGKVYYFPLTRSRSSYTTKMETFLETTGETGFAPVDLAVGPEGDLFVAIGGRGTRGSVFRVRYVGKDVEKFDEPKEDLDRVLQAPQPLAAWSRAKWVPLAKKSGKKALLEQVANKDASDQERIRAIEILTELFDGLPVGPQPPDESPSRLAHAEVLETNKEVYSRAIWSAGRRETAGRANEIRLASAHQSPFVRLAAYEAMQDFVDDKEFAGIDWSAIANDVDRRIRAAALLACVSMNIEFEEASLRFVHPLVRVSAQQKLSAANYISIADKLATIIDSTNLSLEFSAINDAAEDAAEVARRKVIHAELLRLIQLALGDVRAEPTTPEVYAGYIANDLQATSQEHRDAAIAALAKQFPSVDAELNREIARTLAMLEPSDSQAKPLLERISKQLKLTSPVIDDLHYLIVLSRLPGERSKTVTKRTADAVVMLHWKMLIEKRHASRNWPLRVGEMFDELCRRDPKLPAAVVAQHSFSLPAQAMFAARMPHEAKQTAARKLLAKIAVLDDETPWTGELVNVVASLPPEESLPALRAQWHDVSLRDALLPLLANAAQQEDRPKFFESLQSSQPTSIESATKAIVALSKPDEPGTPAEIALVLTALKPQLEIKENVAVRKSLGSLLSLLTKNAVVIEETDEKPAAEVYQPWLVWFRETYPEQAAELEKSAAEDVEALVARLGGIDWTAGDATRGEAVYRKRQCWRCHSADDRVGPALEGVTGRWSREDLFREIADPQRSVAPLYHLTQLATREGRVYLGTLVYESPDATLLQTGPDTTVRVAGQEIVSMTKTRQSLMPTGLLAGATDEELADLFRYLKSQAVKP